VDFEVLKRVGMARYGRSKKSKEEMVGVVRQLVGESN
jgi:hypothetical protein